MSSADVRLPNGQIKAKFVRFLNKGECDCFYDEKPQYYTQGNKVFIKMAYMTYPRLKRVEIATHLEICRWYRFLESPSNSEEEEAMNRICERFEELGGFTPEISKEVGWGKRVVN